MKLTDVLETPHTIIRRESQPDLIIRIVGGQFYTGNGTDYEDLHTMGPGDVLADDWQYQKTVWVGGRKKKGEAEK